MDLPFLKLSKKEVSGMEVVREVKITIYVNTNKTTYVEEFDDLEKAKEYLEGILRSVR